MMKKLYYICILCLCITAASCAPTYQENPIPEKYDLYEDCDEPNSCGEITQ